MYICLGYVPLRLELALYECTSWYARSPINLMANEESIDGIVIILSNVIVHKSETFDY